MGDYNDIFIFMPSVNEIIRIAEGSGDNLLREDIEEGYVDYIVYEQYELDIDIPEYDGGMVMLTKLFREKYTCTEDCVPDVLDMAYDNSELEYIVLKKKQEEQL